MSYKMAILQKGATADGNGASAASAGFTSATFQVEGIAGGAVVTPQISVKGDDFDGILVRNMETGVEATTITADGIYAANIPGIAQVRAPISGYASGAIDVVVGLSDGVVAGSSSGGGGGGGDVVITEPLGRQAEAAGVTVTLNTEDEAALDSIAAGTPAALGRLAAAASQSNTLATEDKAVLDAIAASVAGATPAGNNNIGDVDIASLPNEGQQTMANSISVAVASDQSAVPVNGSVAHDAVDANNPVKVGGYASDTPPADVSANADRVNAWLRRNGAIAVYNAYGANITDDILRALSPGVVIRPTITISATPDYSIGDVVGGIITLSGVMEASGRQAELRSLTVKENSGQAPALTFIFFRATPSGGTYTDNAALAWGTGDAANIVGVVQVLAADYYTVASKSAASLAAIGQLMGSATSDLYLLILADATYNAAATTDLTVEFAFERM